MIWVVKQISAAPLMVASEIDYLAIQGAGGKGAAYIGALQALESLDILGFKPDEKVDGGTIRNFKQLKGVAGTSAGSITAVMLSLGYTASQTNKMVIEDPMFALAFGEKPQAERYRALYGAGEGAAIEVGFFTSRNLRKGLKKLPKRFKKLREDLKPEDVLLDQEFLADPYTISAREIAPFGEEGPLLKDMRSRAHKAQKDLIGNAWGVLGGAIGQGLLKSLPDPVVLGNIADGLYHELYGEYDKYRSYVPFIAGWAKNRDGSANEWGESAGLIFLLPILSDIVDFIDELFKTWEDARENGDLGAGKTLGIAAITMVLMLIVSSLLTKLFNVIDDNDDNRCSPENQIKRKMRANWELKKTLCRMIWQSNVPNLPFITPLFRILLKLDEITFTKSPKLIKKQGKLLKELAGIIDEILTWAPDALAARVGEKIPGAVKSLITPIKIMLSEGGLFDGARVRYIAARLIYEKVRVQPHYNGTGQHRFSHRGADLSEALKDAAELAFGSGKDVKRLTPKNRRKIQDKFNEIEKRVQKIDGFLAAEDELNADIKDLIGEMSREPQATPLRGTPRANLEALRTMMEAVDIREHFDIIQTHYSFEEHKKLFPHHLVLSAANLSTGESSYFNAALTPDFPIVDALGISMAIPGIWRPVAIKYRPKSDGRQKPGGSVTDTDFYDRNYFGWFVDGGVFENLPLFAFNGYDRPMDNGINPLMQTPLEAAIQNRGGFPENHILGISNSGSECVVDGDDDGKDGGKPVLKSGNDRRNDKIDNPNPQQHFKTDKVAFKTILVSAFDGMFGNAFKLRGFEDEPYRSHILPTDYGFMGMLEFAANIEELYAVETLNYKLTRAHFGQPTKDIPDVFHKLFEVDQVQIDRNKLRQHEKFKWHQQNFKQEDKKRMRKLYL